MIYFWSDTHFNHQAILKYCRRPFEGVAEMNESMVERWNLVVKPQDTIYLLGDFGFSHSKLEPLGAIFGRLHGHKHLIIGNHDEKNHEVLKLPWESQKHIRVVKHEGQKLVLCHYPIESWPSAHHGAVHLHGHCHGTLKRGMPRRFDVGADVFVAGPVSIARVLELAAQEPYVPSDHHGDL